MQEPLLMRAVCYDSVLLTDQLQYPFFKDEDDEPGDRFNSTAETELVKWIFNHPYKFVDYLFFQELEIDRSYTPYFEVKTPIIKDSSAPGDIDIILIDKKKPQFSIALQVKRVKATIDENGLSVLKTSQINKGVQQTKWMHEKYRFHKSYLMLTIVTDSQRRNHNAQVFRYNTVEEKSVIYKHSGFGDLPEDIGIYIFEINQPSANSINYTATIAAKALRFAKPCDQLNDTTNHINLFLENVSPQTN